MVGPPNVFNSVQITNQIKSNRQIKSIVTGNRRSCRGSSYEEVEVNTQPQDVNPLGQYKLSLYYAVIFLRALRLIIN